jgi:hypothetical protein
MLKVRKTQMDSLSEAMLKQFEDRMVIHLRSACPEQTHDMPDANLRVMVQSGISKAREYGVIAEDDIRRYLELMIVYGTDFDISPQTSWAGEILQTKDLDGSAKIDRLDEYDLFMNIRNMT